jgi:hypothetical protein
MEFPWGSPHPWPRPGCAPCVSPFLSLPDYSAGASFLLMRLLRLWVPQNPRTITWVIW